MLNSQRLSLISSSCVYFWICNFFYFFTLMWFVCLLQISLPLTVMLLKALWLFFFLTQMFYYYYFFISPSLLLLSSFVQLNQSPQKYLGRMLWDGSGCRMWNDSTMGTASPGPRALNSSRPNPQPFPLGTDQGCRRPTRVSAEVQPKKKRKNAQKSFRDKALQAPHNRISSDMRAAEERKCFPGVQAAWCKKRQF